MTDLIRPRVLRVTWIGEVGGGRGIVTDAMTGEDVSGEIPFYESRKLAEAQQTGMPVEIDIYLLRDGHAYLIGPETVATRRAVVSVER